MRPRETGRQIRECEQMRTNAIRTDALGAVLHCLTTENRLVCLVALETGLRVSDVLRLPSSCLGKTRHTITEAKTGKRKTIRISEKLKAECRKIAGKTYIFENRLHKDRPRTRQAVWKDMRRAARVLRLKGCAPHSMRKTYARDLRRRGFTEAAIQRALNHSSPTITRLYSLADEVGGA